MLSAVVMHDGVVLPFVTYAAYRHPMTVVALPGHDLAYLLSMVALICGIIAAILFLIAVFDGPYSGKAIPLGLFFFVLAHILSGVTFHAPA